MGGVVVVHDAGNIVLVQRPRQVQLAQLVHVAVHGEHPCDGASQILPGVPGDGGHHPLPVHDPEFVVAHGSLRIIDGDGNLPEGGGGGEVSRRDEVLQSKLGELPGLLPVHDALAAPAEHGVQVVLGCQQLHLPAEGSVRDLALGGVVSAQCKGRHH